MCHAKRMLNIHKAAPKSCQKWMPVFLRLFYIDNVCQYEVAVGSRIRCRGPNPMISHSFLVLGFVSTLCSCLRTLERRCSIHSPTRLLARQMEFLAAGSLRQLWWNGWLEALNHYETVFNLKCQHQHSTSDINITMEQSSEWFEFSLWLPSHHYFHIDFCSAM